MNNNPSFITILAIEPYRFGLTFHVKGESGNEYIVDYNFYKGWICDCPDHLFRKHTCKHINAVQEYLKVKFNVSLPGKLFCDSHKADMVFNTVAMDVVV